MKKLLCLFIAFAVIFSCTAFAGSDYILQIGPYTLDAGGCNMYTYYENNILGVEYIISEGYAGIGTGYAYAQCSYFTYDMLGASYEDIKSIYSLDNDWDIAYILSDAFYGEFSGNEISRGMQSEAYDYCYSPAVSLFTCPVAEGYGYTYMACALFVDKDGVFILECYVYVDDAQAARDFRSKLLNKLTCNSKPVITDTPDPAAPGMSERENAGAPITLEIGEGYSLEVSNWLYYDDADKNTVWVSYRNREMNITYLPHPSDGDDPYDTAAYYYDTFYINYAPLASTYKYTEIESTGEMPFLYSGVSTDACGGGYMVGAILVNDEGVLIIEICAFDPEAYYDDLDFFREDVLEALLFEGESALK